MKKKLIAMMMCLTLTVGTFAGCAGGETKEAEDSKTEEMSDKDSEQEVSKDTITITDHADREVEVPAEINRIVVADIYPMASVLTVFLGSAKKLVGIDPVCMSAAESGLLGELFPEILDADTSFMNGADLNVESLLALEPDVVFCSAGNSELISTLENAQIPAVGISPSKWDYDILETYDQWTALLSQMFPENSNKSEEISAYSKEVYEQVQEMVKDIPQEEKKKVLFLFQYDDQQMVTSGKHFFGQFWCDAVGALNAAEEIEVDNSNAVINMEQVYQWNPDVIIITNFTPTQPEDLYHNAVGGDDWSTVKAVQDKQVYKMPLGTYRSYTPSADTPVTLYWMAKTVYPDLFPDLDITKEVKDYYQDLYQVSLTDDQIERMYNPSSAAAENFD
ncbi:corrinoid ABC transporter substrate-binding protein [Blautia hydrogenotrophica]|mgnify:FL=1|uniref:ABC transporter substrate-binding protein n=1 Tax=Blautia hydrogenotrophica TaxID=53443 RepID=UPI0006BF9BFD|nr:ABC transporter substrate-binding protein [Blautia hydrogenotrophica]CUM84798.1 corrinoid ABC transporter substrate-binding protein [Blautia hydrogenotrophica]SCH29593.1 corrinoid ABC transporter substrate-binding protein [uncultured Blautia sp.]